MGRRDRFRGRFLVHAAKGMTLAEYEDAEDFCRDVWRATGSRWSRIPCREALQFGGIIGIATLVGVRPPTREQASFLDTPSGWHMPEQYGFELADVRPVEFVPLRGELGFFDVPDGLVGT